MQEANVLLVSDSPPSLFVSGAVLLSRLLRAYPTDRLTVLSRSNLLKSHPLYGRLGCRHIRYPFTNGTGRLGIGRLKKAANWALFWGVPFAIGWLLVRREIKVMITVAAGNFFLAAAVASRLTGVPMVLIVHDDWVASMRGSTRVLKYFCRPIFSFVARSAAHIYAVSPYMQAHLKVEFGVDSELQMPAAEGTTRVKPSPPIVKSPTEPVRIFYAGTGAGPDSLNLLVDTVKRWRRAGWAAYDLELHLFMPITAETAAERGWCDDRVLLHGWVPQDELREALRNADILYLPFPFDSASKIAVMTAFPTKASDYMLSGKPIIICAPPYSSTARYAREQGFAELVTECTEAALAGAIDRICASADYRLELTRNSHRTLRLNHDIDKQRESLNVVVGRLATLSRPTMISPRGPGHLSAKENHD